MVSEQNCECNSKIIVVHFFSGSQFPVIAVVIPVTVLVVVIIVIITISIIAIRRMCHKDKMLLLICTSFIPFREC